MSRFDGRSQVERELGRDLTVSELSIVGSISDLSSDHLAVIETLAGRQRLAALLYLRAVLPDETTPVLNELINNHGWKSARH